MPQPADKSQEFINSGMTLITDISSEKYLSKNISKSKQILLQPKKSILHSIVDTFRKWKG